MPFIKIKNRDKKIPLNPTMNLLNNILASGENIETICGGKAVCGKCRVKVLEGSKYISPKTKAEELKLKHLLDEGWRLACQTFSLRDITVYIPSPGTEEGIAGK